MELLPTKPLRQQQQQRVTFISERQVSDIDARAAARDATTGGLVSGSSQKAAQNAAICTTAHVQSAGFGDTYIQQSQNAQQLDWRHEK